MRTVAGTIALVNEHLDYVFLICDLPEKHKWCDKKLRVLCSKNSRLSKRKKRHARELIEAIRSDCPMFTIESTVSLLRRYKIEAENDCMNSAIYFASQQIKQHEDELCLFYLTAASV